MKKILSVLLVLTMVLSLGLTFAASAADYTHPDYNPFTDEKLPEANMEHPFDAAIAAGTTTKLLELEKPKANYTYDEDGTTTTPTIIKKVAEDGTETVVDTDTDANATYKYYMQVETITVEGVEYVVVDTWAQIASLARKYVGVTWEQKDGKPVAVYHPINVVLKKDITPQVQVYLNKDDEKQNKLITEKHLEYIFAPVTEGINNIPAMNAVGFDRAITIEGNGYGLTNFSMHAANAGKEGLFGSAGANITLKNIHVGTKAAPIEFTFKGESGLLTSWVAGGSVVTVDNVMLYMKGTGDGNGHMGALYGNKSNGTTDTTVVKNSVFAFEIVRSNHTDTQNSKTSPLGCQQTGLEITNSDFFSYVVTGVCDNALVAANGNNTWDITDVNVYGYGYSNNNMSAFGGYSSANMNFTNVNNYADITANGGSVAGFVGNYKDSNVHTYNNCHNHGDITSITNNGWSFAGGFEGRAQGTVTMTDCSNTGNIVAYNGYAGGFFAESKEGAGAKSFTNCVNASDGDDVLVVSGGANVGGFVGSAATNGSFTFKNCKNFAAIVGTDNVGGFTGWTTNVPVTIDNCVSVVAGMGNNVSGFVAKAQGGQSVANPNETWTEADDADGNGMKDANEKAQVVITNSKAVVYAAQSNHVAPFVGTYIQNVKDAEGNTVTVEWHAMDTENSANNASNVDGDGVNSPMSMEEITALLGADAAKGLNDVEIGYTAAHTDDGNFVRVFGTTAVLPAEYAGFTFSYTYTDENGVLTEAPERTFWSSEVYNGLSALDYSYQKEVEGEEPETVTPFGSFNACKLAGGYIWALTFEDVPAGDVTITVKAFADDVTSESITITLRDGNVYTAPVEGETTEG